MEEIMNKIEKIESEFIELKNNMDIVLINNRVQQNLITNLRRDIRHYEDRLKFMETDLMQFSQYSRRQNIEISNIPEHIPQWKLENHVIMVLQELNIEIYSYDLVGVHRIGKRLPNKNRNVIVRFINRKNAYLALERNWLLRKSRYNKYYINENMCPENRKIFNKCYRLKKNGDIKDVWFCEGIVNMIISDDEEPVSLLHITDIDYFLYEEISFNIPSSNFDTDSED